MFYSNKIKFSASNFQFVCIHIKKMSKNKNMINKLHIKCVCYALDLHNKYLRACTYHLHTDQACA